MIFAGATTSSFENATADGPTKASARPSSPAFSAARRKIEFLITLYSHESTIRFF